MWNPGSALRALCRAHAQGGVAAAAVRTVGTGVGSAQREVAGLASALEKDVAAELAARLNDPSIIRACGYIGGQFVGSSSGASLEVRR